ncbi:hypothetical protein [Hymenobacter psychrophilus]|uniref:Uncharacterized protein n=1 Tax=Hymenobacter psychrophilus TaxID=651662 RepID=A0A1H3DLT2_9BACT|nr:hypothetical protein [Hymenobacter psychrophilus]SDX67317.1 hypothetical protein SAMN04488069_102410 [Hymenobacter psychrophilus]
MASDNSDILALLSDLLRATDRQTDTLRAEMRQLNQETNDRFENIINRFGEAIADGFIQMEKKFDDLKQEVSEVKQEVAGVKQEVAGLRTDVQHIDQRLERTETDPATNPEVLRRLEILESIVLRKAS